MNDPAMTDPGKAHFIFDYSGLSLRQVIALHQQALGEIASLELQLAAWKESVDKAAIRIANLQSSIDNELCDIRLDGEAKSAEIHRLQDKCEKLPGLMAEAEAHRTLLMKRDATIAAMRESLQSTMHYTTCYNLHFPTSGAFDEAKKANALLNDTAQLAADHDAAVRAPLEAQIVALWGVLQKFYFHLDTFGLVDQGDGDLAVKSQKACFDAFYDDIDPKNNARITAEYTNRIRAEAYEAGRAAEAEKEAQKAAYWADGKMPKEPTFSDRETP